MGNTVQLTMDLAMDLNGDDWNSPEHQILITINKVPTFYIDIDLVENIDNIDFLAF